MLRYFLNQGVFSISKEAFGVSYYYYFERYNFFLILS